MYLNKLRAQGCDGGLAFGGGKGWRRVPIDPPAFSRMTVRDDILHGFTQQDAGDKVSRHGAFVRRGGVYTGRYGLVSVPITTMEWLMLKRLRPGFVFECLGFGLLRRDEFCRWLERTWLMRCLWRLKPFQPPSIA